MKCLFCRNTSFNLRRNKYFKYLKSAAINRITLTKQDSENNLCYVLAVT